jgi:hypothetical protein
MTTAAITEAEGYRDEAAGFRKRAKKHAADGKRKEAERLIQLAIDNHQTAVSLLAREVRAIRRQPDEAGYCDTLEALSQSHGSLGGTWRDAWRLGLKEGAIEKAIDAYDAGYEVEQQRLGPPCEALDSYNLLQRLVVRILRHPSCLDDRDTDAGSGLNVPEQLEQARDEIKRQIDAGRTDSWAKADSVLAEAMRRDALPIWRGATRRNTLPIWSVALPTGACTAVLMRSLWRCWMSCRACGGPTSRPPILNATCSDSNGC